MAVRELQVKNNCWAKWYYSSVKCTSSEMPMCPTLTLKLSSGSLSPSVLCAENNKRMRMQEKEREKKRVTEWEECVDNSIGLIADGHSQFLDTPEIITGSLSCVYSLVCHSFFCAVTATHSFSQWTLPGFVYLSCRQIHTFRPTTITKHHQQHALWLLISALQSTRVISI